MPTIIPIKDKSPMLELIGDDENVTIKVTYTVDFSGFERAMVASGLEFEEQIDVIGVDPKGSTNGQLLASFPSQMIDKGKIVGTTDPLPRSRSLHVKRTEMQEDPMVGDADEIRCRIRIAAIGLPPGVTSDVFTNEAELPG
jgi:hypothetical protein